MTLSQTEHNVGILQVLQPKTPHGSHTFVMGLSTSWEEESHNVQKDREVHYKHAVILEEHNAQFPLMSTA